MESVVILWFLGDGLLYRPRRGKCIVIHLKNVILYTVWGETDIRKEELEMISL